MCEILSKGHNSMKDGEKEQNRKIVTFLKKHFQPLAVSYHNEGVGNMAFYYNSPLLFLAGIITEAKVPPPLSLSLSSLPATSPSPSLCSCVCLFLSLPHPSPSASPYITPSPSPISLSLPFLVPIDEVCLIYE